MQGIVIALLGAGSRSFGPETVRDVLLSETLAQCGVELRLMDIAADRVAEIDRGWAHEFCANELDWFYDPADGPPWQAGDAPAYMSVQDVYGTERPFKKQQQKPQRMEDQALEPSGELAIPIIESIACSEQRRLDAINVPNRGFIPNLPDRMVVEVPATSDAAGLHPKPMQPLPEAIAAMIRLQASINRLLVEAFAQQSKSKLLQAVLLEPTVTSYRGAVEMVDEMLALQRNVLPPIV